MDTVVYYSLRSLARLLYLFPESWSLRLGELLGSLAGRLVPKRMALCRANLRLAGLDEALSGAVFRFLGRNLVAILRLACSDPGHDADKVVVEGFESYLEARKRCGRVILITAHLGNWEKLARLQRRHSGHPLQVVGRSLDQRGADRFLRELRQRGGFTVLEKSRGVRAMLKALRQGNDLGLLIDQRVAPHMGIWVPFFGAPVSAVPVVSLLAKASGAAIVPVFTGIDAAGQERIHYLPELVQTGDEVAETKELNRLIETHIRRYPEQWFWLHNRWREKDLDQVDSKGRRAAEACAAEGDR
ncbi:hypothetical protein C2E25_15480 [Geothermobacter hydrogeniphilus]|uniref:KDO2-lipid IV(A) lauroyltransferase n=1 Tax=Geothermobacter hydrogeniphilus TaxID=1969733 RepID=A0A2K2H6G5_9BACT|nr:lysophospholipid acyltransferase family protein [Geothermobacter hydrogeniphilus]PNU18839.1 hypothetical protein C2E25_15480 [Geothermobacter hydrogeniphilus]